MNVQSYNLVVTGEYRAVQGVLGDPAAKPAEVTGGAGFVGAHPCEALVAAGRRVVCIDDFHPGRPANVEHPIGAPGFRLVNHEITTKRHDDFPSFGQIYNSACRALPVHDQSDRVDTARVCASGALGMLERAARDGARAPPIESVAERLAAAPPPLTARNPWSLR